MFKLKQDKLSFVYSGISETDFVVQGKVIAFAEN